MRKSPVIASPTTRRVDDDLVALVRKYRTLLELRRSREALEAAGVLRLTGEARTKRMRVAGRLAQEFPGALRELELLDAKGLRARLAQVEAARAGGRPADWIPVVVDYHRRMRLALSVKRWLSRAGIKLRHLDEAELSRFRRWYGRQPDRLAGPVDATFVHRFVAPPYGRLQELVWSELAHAHGLTAEEARRRVLGS